MDLTHPRPQPAGPLQPFAPAELDHLGLSETEVNRWLWRLAGLGIALRGLLYLLRCPIWTDEAKMATSLLDRSYAGLLEPLAYSQIAPVLFMWIQETATVLFGFTEFSLRLFPLCAGIGSVLLMRHLASRVLGGAPAILAMALFAVSYYPVRHSAELKPYATDLLASIVLTVAAVEWLRQPGRPRGLWLFAVLAPLMIALSYPAIFTAAGILAALAIPVWQQRSWAVRWAWASSALAAVLAFGGIFFFVTAKHFATRSVAKMPWEWGFPPLDDPLGALEWVIRAHTGRTFGYPIGGENGGSLLTFVAFALGLVVLYRHGKYRRLGLLLMPFAMGFIAAVLQKYPYGGSGRVSQYLAPAICLLAGLGAAHLSSLAKRAAKRQRVQRGVLRFLVVFGLLIGTAAVLRPYRDPPDRTGRDFARWFWDVRSRDAELVSAWEDLQLEFARPPARWAPGGAAFRINQKIYYPRRRRGEAADLSRVSRQRPLRVVFQGTAVEGQREALEAWLLDMQTRYELLSQERLRLGAFKEQHGREDWIEVLTFVPFGS
ncbi:MAG: glycosyltransferase family 39 protein [Acidobacteriota bacterium]